MATIKKGTYRWNDTLQPRSLGNIPVLFKANGVFSGTSENPQFDLTATQAYEYISVNIDAAGVFNVAYLFDVGDALNFSLVPAYSSTYGWNTLYQFIFEAGVNFPSTKGFGQFITITENFIPSNADEEAFSTWFEANASPVSTEVTEASVKAKIQRLITAANTLTGKSDTDLTGAMRSLAMGYGQGGEDSPLPIEVATESEMTALLTTAAVGSVYKYMGTTGTYENGALYIVEAVS